MQHKIYTAFKINTRTYKNVTSLRQKKKTLGEITYKQTYIPYIGNFANGVKQNWCSSFEEEGQNDSVDGDDIEDEKNISYADNIQETVMTTNFDIHNSEAD